MNRVFKKIKQIIFAGTLVAVLPGICLYGMKPKSQDQVSESLDDSIFFTEEEIEELAEQQTHEEIKQIIAGTFERLNEKERKAILKFYKKQPEEFTQQFKKKIKEKIRKKIQQEIARRDSERDFKESEEFEKIMAEFIEKNKPKENLREKKEKEQKKERDMREALFNEIAREALSNEIALDKKSMSH